MSRRQLMVAVAAPVIAALAVFLFGAAFVRSMPDEYTASSSVVFDPRISDAGLTGPDTVVLTANNALLLTTSDPVVDAAAKAAGAEPSEVEEWISASIAPSTATVQIAVTAPDGQQAAAAANAVADELVTAFSKSPLVQVSQVGTPVAPEEPSGPPRTVFLLVVAVFSILVAMLVLAAVYSYWRIRMRGGLLGLTESLLTRSEPEER